MDFSRASNVETLPQNTSEAAGKPRRSAPVSSRIVRLDGRTRMARRIAELRTVFLDALGGERAVTPIALTRIESAAHLRACAELARARYLEGEGAIDDVVRAENLAARAERALGIGQRGVKPAGPSLAEHLAARGRARA